MQTHLVLAVVVGPLQLPVDERSLRLGAALQEHAAVLHAVHAPVLHAARHAVHVICSNTNTQGSEECVARREDVQRGCVCVSVRYHDVEGLNTGREGPRS